MEAALKAASALRVEAERKLAEYSIENVEMKAYYSVAVRDSAALKSSSSVWGLSQEKVRLVGYVAAALLLFEALIFLLIYLAVIAF
jgi:hypothetical protein